LLCPEERGGSAVPVISRPTISGERGGRGKRSRSSASRQRRRRIGGDSIITPPSLRGRERKDSHQPIGKGGEGRRGGKWEPSPISALRQEGEKGPSPDPAVRRVLRRKGEGGEGKDCNRAHARHRCRRDREKGTSISTRCQKSSPGGGGRQKHVHPSRLHSPISGGGKKERGNEQRFRRFCHRREERVS